MQSSVYVPTTLRTEVTRMRRRRNRIESPNKYSPNNNLKNALGPFPEFLTVLDSPAQHLPTFTT